MRRAVLLSLILTALTAGVPAGASAASTFRTASNNIACVGSGTFLRCDLRESTAQTPAKPASCELDYGLFFGVSTTAGRGSRLCAGDTVLGSASGILYPGRTWRYRSLRCTATSRSAVRCANRRGHGFAISAARQRLF